MTLPRSIPPGAAFAYGRDLDGVPAREDMEANYRRIAVAAKNVDTKEHDIAMIRRLLPISRRDGGNGPVADRSRSEGLRRRLDNSGCDPNAIADRGDGAGVSEPG